MKGTQDVGSFSACVCQPDRHDETPLAVVASSGNVPIIGSRMTATTIRHCIEIVCHSTGLTVGEMLSSSRRRSIARPRQVAMWLARVRLGKSLPQIASALGLEDHTTVLYGCRRIDRLRATDTTIFALTEYLSELVTA